MTMRLSVFCNLTDTLQHMQGSSLYPADCDQPTTCCRCKQTVTTKKNKPEEKQGMGQGQAQVCKHDHRELCLQAHYQSILFESTGTIKIRDANRGKGLEKKKCRKSDRLPIALVMLLIDKHDEITI
ncbi:hypothetical protein LB507_008421, partial [Fusarium sp. FIESC RH6]